MKTRLPPVGRALLIFCLAIGTTLASAQTVIQVRGIRSCGQWVESRSEKLPQVQTWLVGFLSGLALGLDKDFLRGTDNASIYLWMDNYCRSNPLKDVDDGGRDLAIELIKQKRL